MAGRPAIKPSARAAERADKAARLRPDFARMVNYFPLNHRDSWEITNTISLANKRIEELVRYICAIEGGYMVAALVDMRGERAVLIQLIRDMRSALDPDDEPDNSNDDDGREARDERVARLIKAASKIGDGSTFTSEQRLRGQQIGFA